MFPDPELQLFCLPVVKMFSKPSDGTKNMKMPRILLKVAKVDHKKTIILELNLRFIFSKVKAFIVLKMQLLKLKIADIMKNISTFD